MAKKIGIVGAGIAGLTCGYELQKAGFDVILFEKNDYVGGRMASRVKGDFSFDIGADHLCNLYTEIQKYCTEFGIEWQKNKNLKYGVFKNGQVVPMMDSVGFASKIRMASQYSKNRTISDFFNLDEAAEHDDADAYSEMKQRAGTEVADYLVDGFTSTYQFHRAADFSSGAMQAIMESMQHDKEEWHLHQMKGGMSALPKKLAENLNIKLETPATSVEALDNGQVKVVADQEYIFDLVVLAGTANFTNKIFTNPTEGQKKVLDGSRYATSVSISFMAPVEKLPNFAITWVPFVESEKISGYVNQSMKGDDYIKNGKSMINCWLHQNFAESLLEKSDDEIFAATKEELVRVCPTLDTIDDLENNDLHRWKEAMPIFAPGHLKRVKEFIETSQGDKNVFFSGDYLNSPWTEGALRNGQRVAAEITKKYS